MRNLLLARGTSWRNLWNWRVRELRGAPKDWHLLTTSEPLAEFHKTMTPAEAARLTFRKFPGDRVYMRTGNPNAAPCRGENPTVARVMPPMEVVCAAPR